MSEAEVKVVVNDAFADYERETGKPRHEENLSKFEKIFELMNKLRGAVLAFGLLVGVPGCVASVLVIIRFARGR